MTLTIYNSMIVKIVSNLMERRDYMPVKEVRDIGIFPLLRTKDTEHLQVKWGINFSLCAHYSHC